MMTAKQETERRALEVIKITVCELGKDSYLKAAFEEAFEVAAYNIQNDTKHNVKQFLLKEFLLKEFFEEAYKSVQEQEVNCNE